jgi:hypothetical protein
MIGETLYTYDTNRRRYYNADGTKRSDPDPAHYWEAHTVTGETRNSWILDNGRYKVDKKTLELRGIREFYALARYAFTETQKDDAMWHKEHRHDIVRRVEHADTATLRKIAALLDESA